MMHFDTAQIGEAAPTLVLYGSLTVAALTILWTVFVDKAFTRQRRVTRRR